LLQYRHYKCIHTNPYDLETLGDLLDPNCDKSINDLYLYFHTVEIPHGIIPRLGPTIPVSGIKADWSKY